MDNLVVVCGDVDTCVDYDEYGITGVFLPFGLTWLVYVSLECVVLLFVYLPFNAGRDVRCGLG